VDFAVYLRVIWRFRFLVLLGASAALALALLSVVRIEFDGVTPKMQYRDQEAWASSSTLFVTQEGFPWGRAILDETVKVKGQSGEASYVPRYGDGGRYSGLAQLYVELAKSDAVRVAVLRNSPPGSSYQPDVVKSADGATVLPLIYMTGFGPTPMAARATATVAVRAFRRFLAQEQERNLIPDEKRVSVIVTSAPSRPSVFEPRSHTRPIFVFLLVLGAVIVLAFVLENVRPEIERKPKVEPIDATLEQTRRLA
jgi:hypothetical protein